NRIAVRLRWIDWNHSAVVIDQIRRAVACSELLGEQHEGAEERQPEDLVLEDGAALQHLPRDLVRRQQPSKRLFTAEEEQRYAADAWAGGLGLDASERTNQFLVGESE